MSAATPGPYVVKVGGAALDRPESAAPLWRALADMQAVAPGGVVLVHGGGAAVDRHLSRLGLVSERRAGLRVTPPEQIGEVVAVLAGAVNTTLVGVLVAMGVRAVGLTLGDGGLTRCEAMRGPGGEDLGRVGRPVDGDPRLIRVLAREGFLPVLSSIGLDAHGGALNVNADDGASGVARVVGARGVVLLTDVPGVLDASGGLIDELTGDEAEALVSSGVVRGGMIVKVRAAVRVAQESGIPAVIASWDSPSDLVRVARGERAGTRIVPGAAGEAAEQRRRRVGRAV